LFKNENLNIEAKRVDFVDFGSARLWTRNVGLDEPNTLPAKNPAKTE